MQYLYVVKYKATPCRTLKVLALEKNSGNPSGGGKMSSDSALSKGGKKILGAIPRSKNRKVDMPTYVKQMSPMLPA